MNYVLSETAQAAPREDMALDAGGIWRELHFIDAEGKLTTKDRAAHATIVEPTGSKVWDFDNEEWIPEESPVAYLPDIEIQYINGVLVKRNYMLARHDRLYGEYLWIKHLMFLRLGISDTFSPYMVSEKQGKYTLYASLKMLRDEGLLPFVPDSRYGDGTLVAFSCLPDDTLQFKFYDNAYANYTLPELPGGCSYYLGVTSTYDAAGQRVGDHELYFKGDRDVVLAWASSRGFTPCSDNRVTFYGVTFDDAGKLTGTFKEMVETRIAEIEPRVEQMWVAGNMNRIGYAPEATAGVGLIEQINRKWLAKMNTAATISSSDYDIGTGETVRIISLYFNREVISDDLRQKFNVPDTVIPPPWYGIKYAPKYGWAWLKLADMNYDNYRLPAMPENAHRAFGVATTYPETQDQPPAHNAAQKDIHHCSFITKDHAAVRRWCAENQVADPMPSAPDVLPLWGVYSITHHAVTLQILRVKFYEYFGQQRYDMEGYLDSMLQGREIGFKYDRFEEKFSCIESFGRVFANANKR